MVKKSFKLADDQMERIKLIQIHLCEEWGYQVDTSTTIDYILQACEDMISESQ